MPEAGSKPMASRIAVVFLFILWLPCANAQRPGGVAGAEVWFVTVRKGNNFGWQDLSGNNYQFPLSTKTVREINFHPALFFNGNAQSASFLNSTFSQFTFIGIFYPEYNRGELRSPDFLGLTINPRDGVVVSNDSLKDKPVLHFRDIAATGFSLGDGTTLENVMQPFSIYRAGSPGLTSIWGNDDVNTQQTNFFGYWPEMISYSRVLSATERLKVESYLAIKYGIAQKNYLGSGGDTLWSESPNGPFVNRVAAIGRDDAAALLQPRSNTTYEEGSLSYYTDAGNFQVNRDWPTHRSVTIGFTPPALQTLPDKSFLFWADNGNKPALHDFNDPVHFPGLQLVGRTWKISNQQALTQKTQIDISGQLLLTMQPRRYDSTHMYFLVKTNSTGSSIQKIYPFSSADPLTDPDLTEDDDGNPISTFLNFSRIGWSDISWEDGANNSGYFSFAKAPLLTIGNLRLCRTQPDPVKRCINLDINGGFPPYHYLITMNGGGPPVNGDFPGTNNFMLQGLTPGVYSLTITDTNSTGQRPQAVKWRINVEPGKKGVHGKPSTR